MKHLRTPPKNKLGFSQLILRFFAGGSAIVIVSWRARSKHPFITGVFLLFPIVTMLGFFFLSQSESPEKIRTVTLFTIYSLPVVVIFLVAFYFGQQTVGVFNALIYAIGARFLAAILLVVFNELFIGIGQENALPLKVENQNSCERVDARSANGFKGSVHVGTRPAETVGSDAADAAHKSSGGPSYTLFKQKPF